MNCPHCNSDKTYRNGTRNGVQQYKCKACKAFFGENIHSKFDKTTASPTSKESLHKFLEANDAQAIVDRKVEKALTGIKVNDLYFIDAIYDLVGLPKGYPGLRTTIDAYKEYQGKGMVDGKLRFGHPDTIAMCKQKKAMK